MNLWPFPPKPTTKLPDVHLTKELVNKSTILLVAPRCCRYEVGTDVQSDYGMQVRCSFPAVFHIQLETGQHYDLCENCARKLGLLWHK